MAQRAGALGLGQGPEELRSEENWTAQGDPVMTSPLQRQHVDIGAQVSLGERSMGQAPIYDLEEDGQCYIIS